MFLCVLCDPPPSPEVTRLWRRLSRRCWTIDQLSRNTALPVMCQLSWWGPVLPWWPRESCRGHQRSWTDKLPPYCTVRDQFWVRTRMVLCSHPKKGPESLTAGGLTCNHALLKPSARREGRGSSAERGHRFTAWGFVLENVGRRHGAPDVGSAHLQLGVMEGPTRETGSRLGCQF